MLEWIVWNRTVYMNKINLVLDNLQWLICHKTKQNKNKTRKKTWLQRGYVKKERKTVLIETQNKVVRTINIKVKCIFFGYWGETVNHMITRCSKLDWEKYKQ